MATRAGCSVPCQDSFLSITEDGDSTPSVGNLLHCSITSTVKKFVLVFQYNFLDFSFCPLPLVPGHRWEEPLSVLFTPPTNQVFIHIGKLAPNLLLSRLNSPSSQSLLVWQMLQAINHPHGPSLDLPQSLPLTGEPSAGSSTPAVSPGLSRGAGSPSSTAGDSLCWVQLRTLPGTFAARAHHWLVFARYFHLW